MTNRKGYDIIPMFQRRRVRAERNRWCGSMAEQLICNQQVDGSTPFTSSKSPHNGLFYMGDFPSGQRGQTVNLLRLRFGGPNPPSPTNKKRTFVCQKFSFCLSKPQAWYIITAQRAVHIISPFGAVSHHAPACISLRLDDIQCSALMIYRNRLRMIYTPSA